MNRSLSLARVLALVGGLAIVAAFFMPWFGSQGLLLSGQFLHTFLGTASQNDLRRFLPSSSPTEVLLLRMLVDLFPICGMIAALASLLGGLSGSARRLANGVMGVFGLVPLLAWAIGVSRLPAGATPEVGLALIALGSLAVLIGLAIDLAARPSPRSTGDS
jgi:hypothetical protein